MTGCPANNSERLKDTSIMVNRENVKKRFAEYTRNYNPEDTKIALKIKHTYFVADNCEQIAKSLNLEDEKVDVAWLLGMLHDIGRFEQIKRWGTFIDADSVDHAKFGADLLFKEDKLIETFFTEVVYYPLIETAIREHNKLRISEGLDDETFMFCNILRDADKIDIFRVNVETPLEEIIDVPEEEIRKSPVSDSIMTFIRKHEVIPRSIKHQPADFIIAHMALAFELVYPRSKELAIEQGFLAKMFEYKSDNPKTAAAIIETRDEIISTLK